MTSKAKEKKTQSSYPECRAGAFIGSAALANHYCAILSNCRVLWCKIRSWMMEETFFQRLLGDTLLGKDGVVKTSNVGGEGVTIGLYFSAHWCPPCRGFTPKLTKFYEEYNKKQGDKKFEIVFVSSDKNEGEYNNYYGEMPWLALPFRDRSRKVSGAIKV